MLGCDGSSVCDRVQDEDMWHYGTPHCEQSLAADWCSRGFNCTLIARVFSDQLIGQESTFSTHFIITL